MASVLSPVKPRVLMIAPAMPAKSGHGLAMRLGVFFEALANVADVDLAVLPVAATATGPSLLVARMAARVAVIPCANRPDMHFSLLSRLKDPKARLEAFVIWPTKPRRAVVGGLQGSPCLRGRLRL